MQAPPKGERPLHNALGTFLGTKRYRPIRLLGQGGMGIVYQVEDLQQGGQLALKLLLHHDPQRLLRFKQEFRVMAELHHPNLVRLFDLHFEDGAWFFTMELVEGRDLLAHLGHEERQDESTLLQRPRDAGEPSGETELGEGPRRAGPACALPALLAALGQVLDALGYLHAQGIVHRDLKPSNILVDERGRVRLLDFGLANQIGRELAISQDGAVVGTIAYMSPEQCRGEPATPASDLYAFGCMVYQLLTGQVPFAGSLAQMLNAHLGRRAPEIERRVDGVPPPLAALCARLLAKLPSERPTLDEVRRALQRSGGEAPDERSPAFSSGEIFVGRGAALQALQAQASAAREGGVRLALVSGPSGIGKSALAGALAAQAKRDGFWCLAGRCYERERVPFLALDRALDLLILRLASWPAAQLAPIADALEALRPVFPTVGVLVKGIPARQLGLDPRARSQRAVEGFTRLLSFCQERAPLLLLVDDLQWCDEESVELLASLLANRAGRVLVLGLYRPEGLTPEHPLHRLIAHQDESISLQALEPSEVNALAEAVAGQRLDPSLLAALGSQSEGNPFLARRLVEHLARLAPEARARHLAAAPGAVAWFRDAVESLSPRAEQALSVAATAGRDIAQPLLRDASGLSAEDFDLALAELLSARLLKALPVRAPEEAPGASLQQLDLYHDRIREAAYARLDPARRRQLHRALAEALEAAAPEARDAESLFLHWSEAGDLAKRRTLAREAAEQAASKLAFRRALQLYQVALEDPDPALDPLALAAQWERTGDLYEYCGRFLEASHAYRRALSRWEEASSHPGQPLALLRLRGRVGENLTASGHLVEGKEFFARGLALLGLPLERPMTQRLVTLAALQLRLGVASLLPARAVPTPFEEEQVRFFDFVIRGLTPLWPMPAIEAGMRGELLGRRLGDKRVLLRALLSKVSVAVLLKRITAKEREQLHLTLDEAEALVRTHQIALGPELVSMHRGLLLLLTDSARAKHESLRACEALARHGMAEFYDGAVARAYFLITVFTRGEFEEVLACTAKELAIPTPNYNNVIVSLFYRLRIFAHGGRLEEAADTLRVLEEKLAGAPACFLSLALLLSRRILWAAQGDFARVLASEEELETFAAPHGLLEIGFNRGIWYHTALIAGVALARRGALPSRALAGLKKKAKNLIEVGILDTACIGHWALACLARAAGDDKGAKHELALALSLSQRNTGAHFRWQCLDTAAEWGSASPDQREELAVLAAQGRFSHPLGW